MKFITEGLAQALYERRINEADKGFEKFWKKYVKDFELDTWDMSLETYNFHKKRAMEMYKEMKSGKQTPIK